MKLRRYLLATIAFAIVFALLGYRYWRTSWTAQLQSAAAHADRVRIRTGGVCHRREAEETTLFESMNATEISALVAMMDVTRPWIPMSCNCCGGPTFEFYAGDSVLAMLSLHHGQSLRWPDQWSADGSLTSSSRAMLHQWLAGHGIAVDG